jgi:hypothetical protein
METLSFILILLAMLSVVLSLFVGLIIMTIGGEISKKYSNKVMQARIILQGVAILLFIISVMVSG